MERRDIAVSAIADSLGGLESTPPRGLNPSEKAWVKDVVQGTLRLKGRIDFIMDQYALKKRPSGVARKGLSIGMYQLLAQRMVTPALIVNETVEWVKKHGGHSGFVNSVLRSMVRDLEAWRNWKINPEIPADLKTAHHWASLPKWFWDELVSDYGIRDAMELAELQLRRPEIYTRNDEGESVRLDRSERKEIAKSLGGEGGQPEESEQKIVQDLSSQAAIDHIHEFLKAQGLAQSELCDLCASPGGKSIALAWLGYKVTSSDRSMARMELLKTNIDRVFGEGKSESTVAKGVHIPQIKIQKELGGSFDVVWVDAPCTSSGLISRHPDIRWTKSKEDLTSMVAIQRDLIKLGLDSLKPGGILVYSVCSYFKKEGEGQVQVLSNTGVAKHLQSGRYGLPSSLPEGDGFFYALFKKN